jgi:RNA polymerase-binding transcription factor DksA/predicted small secreted protein
MIRKLILSLILLLLVAATACNTPPVSKKDVSSEAVCQNILLFVASVQTLQDESQFVDQTALKAQFDVVRMNFNNLRMSVSDLQMAEKDDYEKVLEKGTYGKCSNCQKEIPLERLRAYPQAAACLDCQK